MWCPLPGKKLMVEPKKLIYWSCNYEHTSCQLQLWCKAIFLFCCIKCWDMKNEYWLLHKNKTLIPICQNHLNNLVSFQVAHDLPRHTHLPWFDYPSRPPPPFNIALHSSKKRHSSFISQTCTLTPPAALSWTQCILAPAFTRPSYEASFIEYQNFRFVAKVVIIPRKMYKKVEIILMKNSAKYGYKSNMKYKSLVTSLYIFDYTLLKPNIYWNRETFLSHLAIKNLQKITSYPHFLFLFLANFRLYKKRGCKLVILPLLKRNIL